MGRSLTEMAFLAALLFALATPFAKIVTTFIVDVTEIVVAGS
jgi:hypothetical protein